MREAHGRAVGYRVGHPSDSQVELVKPFSVVVALVQVSREASSNIVGGTGKRVEVHHFPMSTFVLVVHTPVYDNLCSTDNVNDDVLGGGAEVRGPAVNEGYFNEPWFFGHFPLKCSRESASVIAGIQAASRRAAKLVARTELPTMIVLWSRTISLWMVLLTDVWTPRGLDLLLVCKVTCCRLAVLLDLEGVLLPPLFPFLDLAQDLSFSIALTTALTISATLSSLDLLLGLPRELDLERKRFWVCFPFPCPGECGVLPCFLCWFSSGLCMAEPDIF